MCSEPDHEAGSLQLRSVIMTLAAVELEKTSAVAAWLKSTPLMLMTLLPPSVLISVVIALLLPLVMAVIDQPALRIASMALISFTMLFLASASKLKPIGGTLALIVAYTLDLLGSVQMGELATRGLLYAWLFIAIPAVVSLCVNLLMAPAPRALVEAEIARRLRLVSSLLVADDAMARRQLAGTLQEGNADLLKYLKMASLEKSLTSLDAAKLMQA